MTFELLDGTSSVKVVTIKEFARALYDNNNRGYNYHKVNFYDNYISLSAPLTVGVHHTLVLTKTKLEEWYAKRSTMREYYADFLEQEYIPLLEEKMFYKVVGIVKDRVSESIDLLNYEMEL